MRSHELDCAIYIYIYVPVGGGSEVIAEAKVGFIA